MDDVQLRIADFHSAALECVSGDLYGVHREDDWAHLKEEPYDVRCVLCS